MRSGIGATKVHVHAEPPASCAPRPTSPAWSTRPACPTGSSAGPWPPSTPWPRPRAACTAARPRASTSTRSGGIDAIIDVVGTCAALEVLGIDEVDASPVANGIGMVRAAHGLLPIPAPAVVELLRGAPTYQLDVPVELTTPTGAALLAALVTEWGPMPAMTIDRAGFGAGSADLGERPNLTQVVIGERAADLTDRPAGRAGRGQRGRRHRRDPGPRRGRAAGGRGPRRLGHPHRHEEGPPRPHRERAGRPRPGRPGRRGAHPRDRLARGAGPDASSAGPRPARGHVDVDGRPIRVKVSAGRVKVEHDDAVRVARQTGRPLREVVSRAEEAWRAVNPAMPDRAGRAPRRGHGAVPNSIGVRPTPTAGPTTTPWHDHG